MPMHKTWLALLLMAICGNAHCALPLPLLLVFALEHLRRDQTTIGIANQAKDNLGSSRLPSRE